VVTLPKTSLYIRRITVSAVFLSIALVIKTASSFYIPLFGQNGMRIDVSGIFSAMPSILFGPVYGALVSGLADLLGFFLKPSGAYLPQMTLIIAAGGFIRGALWMALRGRSSKNIRICMAAISVILLLLGLCNLLFLNADGVDSHFYANTPPESVQTADMHLISRMLVTRTVGANDPAASLAAYRVLMTAGLAGIGAFGIILLLADILISRRFFSDAQKGKMMQLLLAMMISGLIVTTLDTVLLRETLYTSWKTLPFAVVWIPRVIQEVLSNTVYAYFVALLLGIFENQLRLRDWLK